MTDPHMTEFRPYSLRFTVLVAKDQSVNALIEALEDPTIPDDHPITWLRVDPGYVFPTRVNLVPLGITFSSRLLKQGLRGKDAQAREFELVAYVPVQYTAEEIYNGIAKALADKGFEMGGPSR